MRVENSGRMVWYTLFCDLIFDYSLTYLKKEMKRIFFYRKYVIVYFWYDPLLLMYTNGKTAF
jgi:hypothetical protein